MVEEDEIRYLGCFVTFLQNRWWPPHSGPLKNHISLCKTWQICTLFSLRLLHKYRVADIQHFSNTENKGDDQDRKYNHRVGQKNPSWGK